MADSNPTDAEIQTLRDALTDAVDVLVAGATSGPGDLVAHTAVEFQAALNAATPGATIVLDAGAHYVGNFILPARPAGNAPITITSSANVPAAGVRVDPALAETLASIVTTNNAPAIAAASGVHGWRFVGVTIRAVGGATNDIVRVGYGDEKTAELLPSDVEFDRIIIRGDPVGGAKRGILANAHRITLINSDIRDIFRAGQDTTAFGCFNCGTGYTLRNNHLEAGGEVVIFGGAPSTAGTVATDILVEGNTLTRPIAWFTAVPRPDRQVKNLLELKEGRRVVIRGNLLFNHWAAAQPGTAIVITPRDPGKVIEDVLIEYNVLFNTGAAFAILGRENHSFTPTATNRITIRHNLIVLDQPKYGGDGRFVLLTGAPRDLTFDHNTLITLGSVVQGSFLAAYDGGYIGDAAGTVITGGPVSGIIFTNNAMPNGAYGTIANGNMNGAGWPVYFPGIRFVGNVLAGYTAWKDVYPAGNTYPPIAAFGTLFVDYAAGDYRPSPLMPKGTDGVPAGADHSKLPAWK